jgi:hypothetical protein
VRARYKAEVERKHRTDTANVRIPVIDAYVYALLKIRATKQELDDHVVGLRSQSARWLIFNLLTPFGLSIAAICLLAWEIFAW